jgi:hypothetical protein
MRRIIAITKNILLQMNGLFNMAYKPYAESFKKINYTEIFDNLGSLLTNLYIIDMIIQENAEFEGHWEQFTEMFRKVESNYNKYNMNKRMLRKIQRFCEKIYGSMMHGHIFADFLNALRVELRADVGERLFSNKTF